MGSRSTVKHDPWSYTAVLSPIVLSPHTQLPSLLVLYRYGFGPVMPWGALTPIFIILLSFVYSCRLCYAGAFLNNAIVAYIFPSIMILVITSGIVHSLLERGKYIYSIPFHSIPFHSIPFHSVPFHSIQFHSIPFHSISQAAGH